MTTHKLLRLALVAGIWVAVLGIASGVAVAQSAKVQGLINGRSGTTMTLQTGAGRLHLADTVIDKDTLSICVLQLSPRVSARPSGAVA